MASKKLTVRDSRSQECVPTTGEGLLLLGWKGRAAFFVGGALFFELGLRPFLFGVEWLVYGQAHALANVFCGLLHVVLGLSLFGVAARGVRSLERPGLLRTALLPLLLLVDAWILAHYAAPRLALTLVTLATFLVVNGVTRRRALDEGHSSQPLMIGERGLTGCDESVAPGSAG